MFCERRASPGRTMILSYFLLLFLLSTVVCADRIETGGFYCYARCIAKCLEDNTGTSLEECGPLCDSYNKDDLCDNNDCWGKCKNLTNQHQLTDTVPDGLGAKYEPASENPRKIRVFWKALDKIRLYVVEYLDKEDPFGKWGSGRLLATESELSFTKKADCPPYAFRVAVVNSQGFGPFSDESSVGKGAPFVHPGTLHILSRRYVKKPLKLSNGETVDDAYILIDFNYTKPIWPLMSDVRPNVLSSNIACKQVLGFHPIPTPNLFHVDKERGIISMRFAATYMRKDCDFIMMLDNFKSRKCNSLSEQYMQGGTPIRFTIECTNVEGSPCSHVTTPAPKNYACGVKGFEVKEISPKIDPEAEPAMLNGTLTVHVTWTSVFVAENRNDGPILYYAVRYGYGEHFSDDISHPEVALVGVNLTEEIGVLRTCAVDNDLMTCDNSTNEIIISGLDYDTLYGVTICAVHDPQFELPDFDPTKEKRVQPQAMSVLIRATPPVQPAGISSSVLIVAIAVPLVLAICVAVAVVFVILRHKRRINKQQKDIERARLEMEARENALEQRYVDLPEREDVWEIERQHLIVHEGIRLGSGAFGAVYKGKLLVKALGHKHSSSRLVENVQKVEKCVVAVKKLPEYADPFSKGDFLKEIELMKNLGFHENLVNMMACVTKSEPYSLVVEYCSEGDLIHFLRARRDYMIKLDKLGVDYSDGAKNDTNEDLNDDLIVSLKQLLQFALQIAQGLQYLAQKGYVHRDIAARNVLVNREGEGAQSILRAKVGDFGLCRFVYQGSEAYWGKGGRLPIKWMSPEAIKHYEFTPKSDVWSFGVLLFELITLGGSPYPGIQPADMEAHLEGGKRMDQPDNCSDHVYVIMKECWQFLPSKRPDMEQIAVKLGKLLEEVAGHDYFLVLDSQRDYYNAPYSDKTHQHDTASAVENRAFDFEPIPEESLPHEHEMTSSAEDDVINESPRPGLRTVDSGFDSVSLEGEDIPRRRNYSEASDTVLITPVEKPPRSKFKFFLPNLPEHKVEGVENVTYTDSAL